MTNELIKNMLVQHGVKRDHEEGICPVTCKQFVYPDSEDLICWAGLTCSECGELIGARNCELRDNFTSKCNCTHKMGICPVTCKQFSFPMSPITGKFICSECGYVIDFELNS